MTGEVRAVTYDGTVAVLYVVAANGAEVVVAAEPRLAHDIDRALGLGQRPIIEWERWQQLYPRVPVLR